MRRSGFLVMVLGAFLLQGAILWRFHDFTAEDAFIVARYAENGAECGELVYNPGERVSALTSPLHGLLEVLLYRSTGSTIAATKTLSIALVLVAILASALYLPRDEEQAWLFAGMVLPSPFVALWTVGGLETPFLLAIATTATLITRRCGLCPTRAQCIVLSLLLSLCFLTRFDAVLFAAPIVAFLLIRHPNRSGALVLPGLTLALGWMGFAWIYFHDLLPTSFYVKTPWLDRSTLKVNARYLIQFATFTGMAPMGVWALGRGLRERRRVAPIVRAYLEQTWWLPASALLVLAYALSAGTKHMMFSYRLLVPFLPTICIALLDWLRMGREARAEPGGGGVRMAASATLALLFFHLAIARVLDTQSLNPGITGEYRQESRRNYVRYFTRVLKVSAGEAAAHWKAQPASNTRAPRLWTFAAGVVPYYFREAYVFESLISYRKRCQPELKSSADYIHVLTPRLGPFERQLPGPPEAFQLVSSHSIPFDGTEQRLMIFFNRNPLPNPLPSWIDGECRGGSSPREVNDATSPRARADGLCAAPARSAPQRAEGRGNRACAE